MDLTSGNGEVLLQASSAALQPFVALPPEQQQQAIQMEATTTEMNDLLGQESSGASINTEIQAILDKNLADLTDISEAHTLAELTGELSADETALLDRIRTNSIANLSEVVNEETEGLVKSSIADLTARGVLAGNVGTQALADIDKYRTTKLTQGTRDIETALAGQELSMIGENKERQVDLWNLEAKTDVSKAGMALDWESSKLAAATTTAGQQTQWDTARLNALTNIYNTQQTGEWNAADTALGYAQKDATEEANKWDMWGNIGSGISNALMYSMWD